MAPRAVRLLEWIGRALAAPRVGGPPRSSMLRNSLTALTAATLAAPGLAQRTPVTPPAGPRPPLQFVHALSAGAAVWADGTLGPVEVDRSVGGAAPGDGATLQVGARTFATGFGTRASSVIAFDLEGEALLFQSWVGIDEAVGSAGTARFQVLGDGALLFDSGLLSGSDEAMSTGRLDVRGVRELLLVALDGDDGFDQDHADWGDPVVFAPAAPDGSGASSRGVRGSWGPLLPWPVQPVHASLLASGHIVSHASADPTGPGDPDPASPHDTTRVDRATVGSWIHVAIDHPTEELVGAGHARLADGTLIELGGFGGRSGGAATGQDQSSRLEDASGAWIPMAPMAQPRFGAAALTLGDGSLLALGGSNAGGTGPLSPERFTGGRWSPLEGIDVTAWNAVGDPSLDGTFPSAHVTSSGEILWAGWDERAALLDLTGGGATAFVGTRELTQRAWGTSSQLGPDLVVLTGGVDHRGAPGDALRSAARVDTSGATPAAAATLPPTLRRADHDATILADGTLLVTGGAARHAEGTNPASLETAELFDPSTGTWTLCAGTTADRGYRSSALLLPDATVWVGGGDGRADAQVFSPPYLFDPATGQPAPRPAITSAPQQLAYGSTFSVGLASGGAIAGVHLVRAGSSTHGTNADQRFLALPFTQAGASLSVDAPPRGHDAPPGAYMLFAVNAAGVPSTAAWVRIGPPRPSLWEFAFASDATTPEPRHETAMVEVSGKTYLIGGRGLKQTQEYDPVGRTWTDLGPPPFEMHHFQPVALDGSIHVVGAFTGGYPNESNVQNVWTFDPAANSWTVGGAIPPGRRRGAAGTVVYGGKVYLVGGNNQGHNGGARPWFDEYDPVSGTWTVLPDAPRPRDHFLAVVVGNRLVLAGGRATTQPNPFVGTIPEVDVYDFTTGTWSTAASPLPTERAGTMAVPVGRYAVVVGGESGSQVAAHDEVDAFDAIAERWTTLPPLVAGRHSGGIAVLDGVVHVASGSGNRGGSPELPTLEILDGRTLLSTSPTNPVENAGFDDGLTGWTAAGGVALNEWGGVAAPSARIDEGSIAQTLPVVAAQTYRVRALYTSPSGAGSALLRATFLDSGGAVLAQPQAPLAPSALAQLAELVSSAPAGATHVRIEVEAAGGRIMLVDDLTLTAL